MRAKSPIRDTHGIDEWLAYQREIIDRLNDLYLARFLAPNKIRRMCKEAERVCRRKKDRLTFIKIRKHSNPAKLLDECYPELIQVIENVALTEVA